MRTNAFWDSKPAKMYKFVKRTMSNPIPDEAVHKVPKPMRFYFKMWCINSCNRYLINLGINQGKSRKNDTSHVSLSGSASAPLPRLWDELLDDVRFLLSLSVFYNIFLGNLFCSPMLFCFLRGNAYSTNGSLREGRIPKTHGKKTRTVRWAIFNSKVSEEFQRENRRAMANLFGVQPTIPLQRYSPEHKKKTLQLRYKRSI